MKMETRKQYFSWNENKQSLGPYISLITFLAHCFGSGDIFAKTGDTEQKKEEVDPR